MAKSKPNKHILFRFLLLLLLLLLTAAFFFALWLRKEINNTEALKSYRLTYTDNAAESADLLRQLCKEKFSARLYPATSRSHLYLHLAATAEEAEALGTSTDALAGDGFIIERWATAYFFLRTAGRGSPAPAIT